MARASRTIAVEFPLLSEFSDTELEHEFLNRDGAWHSQTVAICAAFGGEKLDLDANWASQPPYFVCPGCGRSKPQLAKITKAGVILCRLDEHHDHLTDRIQSEMRALLGPEWARQISEDAGHIGHACSDLVRRFTPSMVCVDCNTADGLAKTRIPEIHAAFSFSPDEIGRFIAVQPNREHEVDFESAKRVWLEVKASFEDRLELADLLKTRLAAGRLSQIRGNVPPPGSSSPPRLRPLYFMHSQVGRTPGAYEVISAELSSFEARSISRAAVATQSSKRRKPAVEASTDADVAAHDGSGAPHFWHGVTAAWTCTGCNRSRREILRRHRKTRDRWSGRLWKHEELRVIELPGEAPFVDGHEYHLLCGDCVEVERGAKLRQPGLSDRHAFVRIDDIKAVISPQANGPHVVDWAEAIRRINANRSFQAEIESYWRTYRRAIRCWNALRDNRSRLGDDLGYAATVESYRPDFPDMEDIDLQAHVDWLLEIASEHLPKARIIGLAETA